MNKYDELIERAKRFTDTAIVGELINAVSELKDGEDVVHCRECKHSHFEKWCRKYECRRGCDTLKYSNDFCSYGERKEK